MRIKEFIISLFAVLGVVILFNRPVFAHPLYRNDTSAFDYSFFKSAFALKNDNFHSRRSSTGSMGWDFETRFSLLQKYPLPVPYQLSHRGRKSIIFRTEQKRINFKRASIIGMVNASAIFFGFKQAIDSWGKSKSEFHFKDDWKGDNLAQTDEVSHFIWGYKMTQFFFWSYDWVGLSPKTSQALSICQSALLLTLVEYPIDAHNPKQGFGVSDLIFDYLGVGLAYMKRHEIWLEDLDFKISWKRNIFATQQPLFAQTYQEFDNLIYWVTYRTKLFMPQKIFCLGVGYSAAHPGGKPEREFFGGIGLSLPDLASLFGKKLKEHVTFLEIFYPNFSIKL